MALKSTCWCDIGIAELTRCAFHMPIVSTCKKFVFTQRTHFLHSHASFFLCACTWCECRQGLVCLVISCRCRRDDVTLSLNFDFCWGRMRVVCISYGIYDRPLYGFCTACSIIFSYYSRTVSCCVCILYAFICVITIFIFRQLFLHLQILTLFTYLLPPPPFLFLLAFHMLL